MSAARRVAHAVVVRALAEGAYVDRALRAAAEDLEPRDRALAKQLAFGATQRRGTLDWVIANATAARGGQAPKLEPRVRAALQLGLFELLFLSTADHAAVSEAVDLAKPSPGHKLVNAVLRRVQREGVELPSDETPAGAAIRHSHPRWLVDMWWEELGAEETRALLAANNEPAELAVRQGLQAVVVDRIDEARFAAGEITPMSRAAQLVAPRLDPQPGERVLDLCAAPGGKTAHIAALMQDTGEVVAVERHAGRARELAASLQRQHVTCVEVVVADGKDFTDPDGFDRVLIDPPCSGLGTLRGHPDLRWQMTPDRIPKLVEEQDALLAAGRAALREGGTLVYSTCTISKREERLADPDAIRTLPHRDGTDGFYIARACPRR
ncbi:MAG TPA: transcription antitermination factor NusB [Solirubrobacteraceae bacterium]